MPPGTGKTTLLRSVVANMWVDAALKQGEPPLIVAASNNNQAVTNILESFARVDESGMSETLIGRWLPDIATYGLYCCAQSKANDNNDYDYHGPGNEGMMAELQTQEYLEKATTAYLAQASRWGNKNYSDVNKAAQDIIGHLKVTVKEVSRGFDLLSKFERCENKVNEEYGSYADLLSNITSLRAKSEEQQGQLSKARSNIEAFYVLWENRSWWAKWFDWIPLVRKINLRGNARLLNKIGMTIKSLVDDAIEDYFNTQINAELDAVGGSLRSLKAAEVVGETYGKAKSNLDGWLDKNKSSTLHSKTLKAQVEEVCDRSIRFKAFKLATHYWEARWLSETQEFVDNQDEDKKSPFKLKRKWRRFAKLTPCFVSTFYMVPTFFTAFERKNEAWADIPLFSEIDLLIIDEAGQALSDVSSASFALAKRSLAVGDTDQIEPVWSIPASIDRANLKLFNLLDNEQDYVDFWLESGLLASSGNLMRIAQRQSHYHQFGKLQRGLYLTEHRRCYDSIIRYCNDLVYKGVLEPLRGSPEKQGSWPILGFVPVNSLSQKLGSSRGNPGEAEQIAGWISANKGQIISYARAADKKLSTISDEDVLFKAVGVVTPFSKQSTLISTALKAHGIKKLTVGTVHRLQGDERLFVLFSSVYGENDKNSSKFYDKGCNMLNVAVSRAKDFFWVFGHIDVFGCDSPSLPSSKLRLRLNLVESSADVIADVSSS